MKVDDDGYSEATMVMTEHQQGDEVVDSGNSGDGGEVESGTAGQDHDVEAPQEQTEDEEVGWMVMKRCLYFTQDCRANQKI